MYICIKGLGQLLVGVVRESLSEVTYSDVQRSQPQKDLGEEHSRYQVQRARMTNMFQGKKKKKNLR